MSTSMSKEIQLQGLSSSLIQEEQIMLLQKQGIVTILGSEEMKNIASSEEFSHSKVTTTNADSKAAPFDLWSSILLPQRAIDETINAIITPYIHPLVKKSKNTLSQKSLEICTESLGSETGSDGFSSEEDKEEMEQTQLQEVEEITLQVPEFKSPTITSYSRVISMEILDQKPKKHKSWHHSFPPPIPSLHMLSHRDNGRLFIQAVVVPSNNNFCAKREDGRLVLTFANEEESKVQEMEEDYDEEENEVENNEEKNDVKDVESMIEQPTILSSDITSVHRPKLVRLKLQLWNQQQQLRLLSMLMKTATGGPSSLQKLLHFLNHLPINNI
ncbi:hypothetical protein Lal_00010053 [Lupinus albus]|uniref:Putative The fantastic four family protein n=1 Tax=Lupinus albus TaxID=3870 RepID=A0A6A4N5U2_LUPAL|nr:putative The fantastic four family protein [Lupinus albus]KAF1859469.1 hypothetical protein Lal_00010053 [Lupinus albus]